MKKRFSLLTAFVLALMLGIMGGALFASGAHAYGSNIYWTNTAKVGAGHFAYGETAGDGDSGTAYTAMDRLNYHNGMYMATLRVLGGYVPATYTDWAITGNVHYLLNDFSVGSGVDVRALGGLIQNELYASIGQSTTSFLAGNASFSGGATGYDEYYTVDYLGLTYKNIYALTRRVSNVLKLNYLYGLNGTVTTKGMNFANVKPGQDVQANLSGENGYSVSEGVRYRLTNDVSLVGDVYYSALFSNSSNSALLFYQLSSMTHQYGLQLGVRYTF